jgi:hypothetical protein
MGFKTYVVGLPGAQSVGAETVLNQLAVAGGTGRYVDPADPASLQTKISDIVLATAESGLASCDIALTPATLYPDALRLVVTIGDEEQAMARDPNSANSGTVTPDGSMVTLHGLLCDNGLAGSYEDLRFDFGCQNLPDAPAP